MKIQSLRRIRHGDIPELSEQSFRALMPLQEQAETLTIALQSRLSTENFQVELRRIVISDDTETTLTLQNITLKDNPMVFVGWEALNDYHKMSWRILNKEQIAFKVKWDSAPSSPVEVLLIIWA